MRPSFQFRRLVALTLSVCVVPMTTQVATKDDYHGLLQFLFTNYSRDVRPTDDFSQATELYMGLYLLSILDVNEKAQTLKTNCLLDIEWEDDYLSWDTTQVNITSILARQKSLWLPDIGVSNTVTAQKEMGYDNLKLRIYYDGLVAWSPSEIFETACDIDITYYPFDTQVCEIIFKTAVSQNNEISVYIDKQNPIDTSSYSPNGLWHLLNSSAENSDQDANGRTTIKYKLQLQRRRSYYILNLIMPILFLSVTSSLTFALPSDAGEKMGLSITVLLAYAVYLTLVTDSMPDTSTQVAVLTVYLILLLAITASSVVLSVFILRLHHRPPSSPVTGRLATVAMVMRSALCMDPLTPGEDYEEFEKDQITSNHKSGNNAAIFITSNTESAKARPRNAISPSDDARENTSGSQRSACFGHKVKAISGSKVAETFDKFIFILFSTLSVAITFICIVILLVGAETQEKATSLS